MRRGQSAKDVTAALRDFLQGTGGEWDWDDFISLPQTDPELESIRRRAAAIALPPGPAEKQALQALLAETEALVRGPKAPCRRTPP